MTNFRSNKLFELMSLYAAGRIGVVDFCQCYETAYNFEINRIDFPLEIRRVFDDVFERIVRYSPYQEEVAIVPHYIGEQEVEQYVVGALEKLSCFT